MWSIVDAKSQLSEILRRARAGEPQVIGSQNPCVVVSLEAFEAKFADHDGAWLLQQTAGLNAEIALPPRGDDRKVKVFE
jgi:prevent-host-death family protein